MIITYFMCVYVSAFCVKVESILAGIYAVNDDNSFFRMNVL
jgi:hypothetical protein